MLNNHAKLNIVGVLSLCAGVTLALMLGRHAMSVQAFRPPSDSVLGSVVRADDGIGLRRAGAIGWQRSGIAEYLRPDDVIATEAKEAVLDLELGRRLTLGPNSSLNLVAVGRAGGTHDIQVVLSRGSLQASQTSDCQPCGVLIVVAGDSSFEVHRGKSIGVRYTSSVQASEFDPKSEEFQVTKNRDSIALRFLNRSTQSFHILATEDPFFQREWWTDRSSDEMRYTAMNLPLAPPRDRPPGRGWRPFVEIWGEDGFAPRHRISVARSFRPKLQVGVNQLFQWASASEETGARKYTFHMRGGSEIQRVDGTISHSLQAGDPTYSIFTLGDVASANGGTIVGLDQLQPKLGSVFFPAKAWLDPSEARVQIWLPPGSAIGMIGRFVRGANRVGWKRGPAFPGQQSTVLLRRGQIIGAVGGQGATDKEVRSLRRSLGADSVVRAEMNDFVLGSPEEVATKIYESLARGKPYFAVVNGRASLLEPHRFANVEALKSFIRITGSAVLVKEVAILSL